MSTSHSTHLISRGVGGLAPYFTGDLSLIYHGPYSYVVCVSTEAAAARGASSKQNRLKIFRERAQRGFGAAADNIPLTLLAQYEANPAAYQHPNIAPPIPLTIRDERGGQSWLTTALVFPWYGEDILAYNPTSPKIKLVVQVARAVKHLHSHNITHGNIYPGNVLVTNYGEAMLTDTSVRTLARHLYPHTTVSLVVSSMYQAPEYLWAGTDAFVAPTKATDIYALASTIFAIFTGGPPFRNARSIRTIEQAVAKILRVGHLCLTRPADGSIDGELWSLLQTCWSRTPGARPSIGELVAALETIESRPDFETRTD